MSLHARGPGERRAAEERKAQRRQCSESEHDRALTQCGLACVCASVVFAPAAAVQEAQKIRSEAAVRRAAAAALRVTRVAIRAQLSIEACVFSLSWMCVAVAVQQWHVLHVRGIRSVLRRRSDKRRTDTEAERRRCGAATHGQAARANSLINSCVSFLWRRSPVRNHGQAVLWSALTTHNTCHAARHGAGDVAHHTLNFATASPKEK